MRVLILAAIISFFISCNHDTKSLDKKEVAVDRLQSEQDNLLIHQTNSLIGEWGIYATISNNGMETNCNACPKIKFDKDETATLILPSGDKSKLKWKADKNKLTINYIDSSVDRRTFSDSNYIMTFTKEKAFIELELKQTKKNYSMILRR